MFVAQKGELKFRSHAVRTADKDGFAHACKIRCKQAAEIADGGHCTGRDRARNVFFHQFNGAIARSNINARFFVAFAPAVVVCHLCSSFRSDKSVWFILFGGFDCVRGPSEPRFFCSVTLSAAAYRIFR